MANRDEPENTINITQKDSDNFNNLKQQHKYIATIKDAAR